jgi:hypothetical protein
MNRSRLYPRGCATPAAVGLAIAGRARESTRLQLARFVKYVTRRAPAYVSGKLIADVEANDEERPFRPRGSIAVLIHVARIAAHLPHVARTTR